MFISQDIFITPLTSRTTSLLPGEFLLAEWAAAGLHVPTLVKRGLYTPTLQKQSPQTMYEGMEALKYEGGKQARDLRGRLSWTSTNGEFQEQRSRHAESTKVPGDSGHNHVHAEKVYATVRYTAHETLMHKRVGRLTPADVEQVDESLRQWLGLT